MKGWVGLVGWPVADGLLTLVVTHQLQVERRTLRTRNVRQSESDVLPLCHATNCRRTVLQVHTLTTPARQAGTVYTVQLVARCRDWLGLVPGGRTDTPDVRGVLITYWLWQLPGDCRPSLSAIVGRFVCIYCSLGWGDSYRPTSRGGARATEGANACITYCREQFNFELPSVILARHTSLFLDKLRHCDNCLIKNVMRT